MVYAMTVFQGSVIESPFWRRAKRHLVRLGLADENTLTNSGLFGWEAAVLVKTGSRGDRLSSKGGIGFRIRDSLSGRIRVTDLVRSGVCLPAS
jgi:hypothetical protein